MTPCRRVLNDQLATLKQYGGRRRRPSGLWSICVSGDCCGDAVGFSLSTRRQCNGHRQAERDRQKIAAIPASASILPSSWHWARAATPTVAARTRIVSAAGIRLDHRKSVRPLRTFLSSSPTLPASQSRFYVPRQFARAFGNDRFQGLEPYPSIAALVQFSVVKPCAPSGVR